MSSKSKSPTRYLRFSLARRIEHWVMVLSFITLSVTGLPQKYINSSTIAIGVIDALGGIERIRIIHRWAAIVLMVVSIWHLGTLIYNWLVRRGPLTMLPGKDDLTNAWDSFRYNFGRIKDAPKQGFYTFEEKFEYWALVWGTLIMIVTGFFLWNPITAAKFVPGSWIPVAKTAHGNEALLAVLAVILWHFYHVLVKHFNTSMFTGYLSRHEMEELHPLAMDEEPAPPKDEKYKRRRAIFAVVYGIASVAMLAGLYWFVNTEQTAVDIPDAIPDLADIDSFSPVDPTPFPTAMPFGEAANIGTTWDDGIGDYFRARCGTCHGIGSPANDLNLTSYAAALQGGMSGPAIVPGSPGISLAVIWQLKDFHPGRVDLDELVAIQQWIANGAPQQ